MSDADFIAQALLVVLCSYLLGAFPTAYFVGAVNGINIFESGSGNMGGTNVARAVGGRWALLTIALDVGKALLALALARELLLPAQLDWATSLAATAVVLGHSWSILATALTARAGQGLGLRGGKGAATAFGAMLVIQPLPIFLCAAVAVAIIRRKRYVSLGVLLGYGLANAWLALEIIRGQQAPALWLFCILQYAVLLLRHRGNIQRLLAGTERRIGEPAVRGQAV